MLSGIKSNKIYLYGCEFEVLVDHRPLVPLYNDTGRPSLARVNRYISKLLEFNFRVLYEPGSANPCDYGSRHPKMILNINKLTELEK